MRMDNYYWMVVVCLLCWISSSNMNVLSNAFSIKSSNMNRISLLSDVPTPSIIFDISSLQKRKSIQTNHNHDNDNDIPFIHLDKYNVTLVPIPMHPHPYSNDDDDDKHNNNHHHQSNKLITKNSDKNKKNEPMIGWNQLYPTKDEDDNYKLLDEFMYFHSSVIRGANDNNTTNNDDDNETNNFLAQLDLLWNPNNGGGSSKSEVELQLVLGLNNHHVGSYYWARSAGRGACMEAPGIKFIPSNGILCWQQDAGFIQCNSNDGKRSEWVNFLKIGDTVQLILLPSSSNQNIRQHLLLQFLQKPTTTTTTTTNEPMKLFGITSKGRPMGSEPAVICEYICKSY